MTTAPNRLKEMLRDVVAALSKAGVHHAMVGGMALAAHGLPRATKDIDFLIDEADREAANIALRDLGFQPEIITPGFLRYVRHPLPEMPELTEWADLLLARQDFGRSLLAEAKDHPVRWEPGLELLIVSVEGLVLMKLLAAVDDPGRVQDRSDIVGLLRLHADTIDRSRIHEAAIALGSRYAEALHELETSASQPAAPPAIPGGI